mmetsp:Transcript_57385/g.79626  ORF Transcript_57385/g.79626 Transcript_57385/m.79626 type:complete len:240 (+) Transcript_57385:72-791(+)
MRLPRARGSEPHSRVVVPSWHGTRTVPSTVAIESDQHGYLEAIPGSGVDQKEKKESDQTTEPDNQAQLLAVACFQKLSHALHDKVQFLGFFVNILIQLLEKFLLLLELNIQNLSCVAQPLRTQRQLGQVLVLPCHELRLLLSLSVKEGLVVLDGSALSLLSGTCAGGCTGQQRLLVAFQLCPRLWPAHVLLKLLEYLTRLRHETPAACQLCIADLEGATVAFDHADCGMYIIQVQAQLL